MITKAELLPAQREERIFANSPCLPPLWVSRKASIVRSAWKRPPRELLKTVLSCTERSRSARRASPLDPVIRRHKDPPARRVCCSSPFSLCVRHPPPTDLIDVSGSALCRNCPAPEERDCLCILDFGTIIQSAGRRVTR